MVETIFPVKFRYIMNYLLSDSIKIIPDNIKGIIDRIADQFEENTGQISPLPLEKKRGPQFKNLASHLVQYILYGPNPKNQKALKEDFFWLDIYIYSCEKCYLDFTKIIIDTDMKMEFQLAIPKRDILDRAEKKKQT